MYLKNNRVQSLLFITLFPIISSAYQLAEPEYDAGNKYVRVICENGDEGVAEYNGIDWFYIDKNERIVCNDLAQTAKFICDE